VLPSPQDISAATVDIVSILVTAIVVTQGATTATGVAIAIGVLVLIIAIGIFEVIIAIEIFVVIIAIGIFVVMIAKAWS